MRRIQRELCAEFLHDSRGRAAFGAFVLVTLDAGFEGAGADGFGWGTFGVEAVGFTVAVVGAEDRATDLAVGRRLMLCRTLSRSSMSSSQTMSASWLMSSVSIRELMRPFPFPHG
ncbi:hypothetical protein ASD08_47025 [Streptomyces sp. Root369]|nr:hypothetical protein ASD08_47025 [Streptomyces sp. Root369]